MSGVILVLVCISLLLGLLNLIGLTVVLSRIKDTEWGLRGKLDAVRDQILFHVLRLQPPEGHE